MCVGGGEGVIFGRRIQLSNPKETHSLGNSWMCRVHSAIHTQGIHCSFISNQNDQETTKVVEEYKTEEEVQVRISRLWLIFLVEPSDIIRNNHLNL